MYSPKILTICFLMGFSSFANAQFPANEKGGMIGFTGGYGNSYGKNDLSKSSSNNWGVGLNPGITCFGKNYNSFNPGIKLSLNQSHQANSNSTITIIDNSLSASVGLFANWSKWKSITNAKKFFFTTGPGISADLFFNVNHRTSDALINKNGSISYAAAFIYHFGISYIRNARWIWQLKYYPVSINVSYRYDTPIENNNFNGTLNANISAFNSGVGFSLIYLFGKKTELTL